MIVLAYKVLRKLQQTESRADEIIKEAKERAKSIIRNARASARTLVTNAKAEAIEKGKSIVSTEDIKAKDEAAEMLRQSK